MRVAMDCSNCGTNDVLLESPQDDLPQVEVCPFCGSTDVETEEA